MLLAGVTLVLGVALGYARGGRLGRLESARLRGLWALGIAVGCQASLLALGALEASVEAARLTLLLGSLVAVLAFVWANRALPGMWLVLVGFALNAAVIVPNGAMPVSPEAIAYLGGDEAIEAGKHQLLEDGDALPWLADVIPIPVVRIVVSVGDIVLALGVGVLMHRLMRGPIGRHAAAFGERPGSGRRTSGARPVPPSPGSPRASG